MCLPIGVLSLRLLAAEEGSRDFPKQPYVSGGCFQLLNQFSTRKDMEGFLVLQRRFGYLRFVVRR